MDAHKYVAGQRPTLVVGRNPDLPKVDRLGNLALLSEKDQQEEEFWDNLAEHDRIAELSAINCNCNECLEWLAGQ